MIEHSYDIADLARARGAYVACGCFDGLHRGHRALIAQMTAAARAAGRPAVLASLYDAEQPVLTTEAEKAYLLAESSLDLLLSLPRAAFSPQRFATAAQAAAVFTADVAAWAGCGLPVLSCVPLVDAAGPLSTERLRAALAQGDLDAYAALAGGAYLLRGPVVHGAGRGRAAGLATANLGVHAQKLLPPHGVYATISRVDGGVYMGLTNIGRRPSVDDCDAVTVETHLLDFDRDIYGCEEILELHFYIRGVRRLAGLAAVRRQVQADQRQARARLARIYARCR